MSKTGTRRGRIPVDEIKGDGSRNVRKIELSLRGMKVQHATKENIIDFLVERTKDFYTDDESGTVDTEQLLLDCSAFIRSKTGTKAMEEIPELVL